MQGTGEVKLQKIREMEKKFAKNKEGVKKGRGTTLGAQGS